MLTSVLVWCLLLFYFSVFLTVASEEDCLDHWIEANSKQILPGSSVPDVLSLLRRQSAFREDERKAIFPAGGKLRLCLNSGSPTRCALAGPRARGCELQDQAAERGRTSVLSNFSSPRYEQAPRPAERTADPLTAVLCVISLKGSLCFSNRSPGM